MLVRLRVTVGVTDAVSEGEDLLTDPQDGVPVVLGDRDRVEDGEGVRDWTVDRDRVDADMVKLRLGECDSADTDCVSVAVLEEDQ